MEDLSSEVRNDGRTFTKKSVVELSKYVKERKGKHEKGTTVCNFGLAPVKLD